MQFEEEVGSLNMFIDVGFEERHLEIRARFMDSRERILGRHLELVGMGPESNFYENQQYCAKCIRVPKYYFGGVQNGLN